MKKAYGYVRVSTLKQVKGHSLEYQKEAIEKYCKANDITLAKLFVDKGISGYKFRKELEAMETMIEKDPPDYVITYSITRYSRSTADLLLKISMLQEKGISFVSIKEQFDMSSKIGKLLLTVLSAIADFEAETIRERMQAGREWAREHGTKSGKPIGRQSVKGKIDFEYVKMLREKKLSWRQIAKIVEVSCPALIKHARDEGIG